MILGFKEWLAEQLIQTELFEMAESKAHAEKTVRGLSDEIIFHIIKILYWKDEVNYNKHINDIDTWLDKISRITLKPNSKYIKEKDLYHWLWAGPYGEGSEWFKERIINNRALLKYRELPRTDITDEECYNTIQNACKLIAKDISCGKYTTIVDYL